MCGRYTSQTAPGELADLLEVDVVVADDLGPRYNVAPTQDVYAVAEHEGMRRLGVLRWGLVPSWAKDPSIGSRLINARAETVATSSAFRRAFASRRCLVPADGFYEWRTVPGARRKQPYLVRRADGRPMVFAGLWERWRPPDGGREVAPLVSCTIITTEANAAVRLVHDRMPVVLDERAWPTWLDPTVDDPDVLQALLVPAPDDALELVPVGDLVGDVRNDGPELVEPVDEPGEGRLPDEQPTLFDIASLDASG